MKSTLTRIASAAVVLVIFFGIYFQFKAIGLRFLCYIAVILGVRELSRMLFDSQDTYTLRIFFSICVFSIFYLTSELPEYSTPGFALISILYCSFAIVLGRKESDLVHLSLFQAKSILGFVYIGILPALASLLLKLPNGEYWFLSHLIIVFLGDTFAYTFGLMWGNKKLIPTISPKKTVQGAVGGLFGSIVFAIGSGYFWFPTVPFWLFAGLGAFIGIVAQLGDFFESLLKRVANVKDSGGLMPGHGGVLDRLDGVLFTTPIMFLSASFIQRYFF